MPVCMVTGSARDHDHSVISRNSAPEIRGSSEPNLTAPGLWVNPQQLGPRDPLIRNSPGWNYWNRNGTRPPGFGRVAFWAISEGAGGGSYRLFSKGLALLSLRKASVAAPTSANTPV